MYVINSDVTVAEILATTPGNANLKLIVLRIKTDNLSCNTNSSKQTRFSIHRPQKPQNTRYYYYVVVEY